MLILQMVPAEAYVCNGRKRNCVTAFLQALVRVIALSNDHSDAAVPLTLLPRFT